MSDHRSRERCAVTAGHRSAMIQSQMKQSGLGDACNISRGLTRFLDSTKEGLMPDRTPSSPDAATDEAAERRVGDCHVTSLTGNLYQIQARTQFEIAGDVDLDPLVWVKTTCGNPCVNPDHLIVHQPVRIAYPAGVCAYCGMPSGTKDHLIPRTWTGDTRRYRVAVVPACAECNSAIGAQGGYGIHERRAIAHAYLRRKYRKELAAPTWSDDDLSELGPTLRSSVEAAQGRKRAALSRLGWPEDPFYDMRAWQRSGVDDPVAIGAIAHPMSPESEVAA